MQIDAVHQAVADALLVGGVPRGAGEGRAPVDLQIAELVRAGELGVDQGALEPLGVVVAHVRPGQFVVAGARAGFLRGRVDVEVGPADLVLTPVEADAEQAVQHNVVLGGDVVVVGADLEIRTLDDAFLLNAVPGAPGVVEAGDGDHAERTPAEVDRGAGRDVDGVVRVDAGGALQQVQRRIDEGLADVLELFVGEVGAVDPQTAAQRQVKLVRGVARAVVIARPVGVGAVVDEAVVEGGFGVAADAEAQGHEGLVGHGDGLQVDHAAAELAGIGGRVGLLHRGAGQHVRREEVERHDALQRLGARQRRAVQQGRGIALAQAADIDEAAAHDRQAGQAGQGLGRRIVALPLQVVGGQDGGHFGRFAHDVGDVATPDDQFLDLGLRPFRLSKGGLRRKQRRRREQHRAQGKGDLHVRSPVGIDVDEIGRRGRSPPPESRQQDEPDVRPQVQPCHQVSLEFRTAPM